MAVKKDNNRKYLTFNTNFHTLSKWHEPNISLEIFKTNSQSVNFFSNNRSELQNKIPVFGQLLLKKNCTDINWPLMSIQILQTCLSHYFSLVIISFDGHKNFSQRFGFNDVMHKFNAQSAAKSNLKIIWKIKINYNL